MPSKKHTSVKTNQQDSVAGLTFDNSYAKLPEHFFERLNPIPVQSPHFFRVNHALAGELGLAANALESIEGVSIFAGNHIPSGAEPIAMAYAGHQFGNFVPQLGDGRALLLGEVIDRNGQRRDIQLKGSGQTPFSRGGDGRAALGPVIREYILSEAMHALGIRTTRSLAAVTTGEPVFREAALPGAILTRVAASHVRVGTFQYFAARDDKQAIGRLADYVIDRHYPNAKGAENPYRTLLEAVIDAQAALVASWMHVGFIHGVMNTDNTAISGETIDYGPCAFMEAYDPATVFSSIDHNGRYAYGNQGHIAHWNLARFAETLLPLLDPNLDKAMQLAEQAIESFQNIFGRYWLSGMCRKIGLFSEEQDDLLLIQNLLELMQRHAADYTLTFRQLSEAAYQDTEDSGIGSLFSSSPESDAWLTRWKQRLQQEHEPPKARAVAMRNVNPAYIPRNHRVEQAIEAAVAHGDFSRMDELITLLSNPFKDQPRFSHYADPPKPEERIYQTFCGT